MSSKTEFDLQTLVPELAAYTRRLFADLTAAKLNKDYMNVKGLCGVDIHYATDMWDSTKERILAKGGVIYERKPEQALHPHIIEGFRRVFNKIANEAGLKQVSGIKYVDMKDNDLSFGGTFSLSSIYSFGVTWKADAGKLQEMAAVSDEKLEDFCCAAVQEYHDQLQKFAAQMEDNKIDLTKPFDPAEFVRELEDKGLRERGSVFPVVVPGRTFH